MRSIELARAAVSAERIRWEAFAARQARRATIASAALICGVGAFGSAHVVLFLLGAPRLGSLETMLALLCFDLVAAAALGIAAAYSSPSRLEREAGQLRRRALEEVKESLPADVIVESLALFLPARMRPILELVVSAFR